MAKVKTKLGQPARTAPRAAAPAAQLAITEPLFGAHMSIAGGVENALVAAQALQCRTAQVFVRNQRQWRAPPMKSEHVFAWLKLLSDGAFGPVLAHGSYLVNLGSRDTVLRRRSHEAFADEFARCAALQIAYLVIHPGAYGDDGPTAAMQRVAETLDAVLADSPPGGPMVLLETTAGQGRALGRRFAELADIIGRVQQPERVGVCVDTCHIFAAGYDIRTPAGFTAMLDEADRTIGLQRIHAWHLNDSKGAFASGIDRHAHIGQGKLGTAAFKLVVTHPRFRGQPMVLETPKGTDARGRDWDKVNLATLRRLARARPAR